MGQSDRVDVTFVPKIGTILPKSTLYLGRHNKSYYSFNKIMLATFSMTLYIFKFLKRQDVVVMLATNA
jgi:hypothetical protein